MNTPGKIRLSGAFLALLLTATVPAHADRLKRVELPIDMSKLDTDKDGFLDSAELTAKADANANVGGTMGKKGSVNGGGSAGGGGEGGSNGSSASGGGG